MQIYREISNMALELLALDRAISRSGQFNAATNATTLDDRASDNRVSDWRQRIHGMPAMVPRLQAAACTFSSREAVTPGQAQSGAIRPYETGWLRQAEARCQAAQTLSASPKDDPCRDPSPL